MAKLKLTLVKSPIGHQPDQRATVRALGLRKLNSTVEQDDNPVIRGMVQKIVHLLKVEKR